MQLMKEVISQGIDANFTPPCVHCMVFEDNRGAIELVQLPKIRPRMKHINNYYHHFHSYTEGNDPEITIQVVGTKDQLGHMLTKPLPQALFTKFQQRLMGW